MQNQSQPKKVNCYEKLDTLNEKLKQLARVMSDMNKGLKEYSMKN